MIKEGRTINGIRVGRAESTKLIPIDSDRLSTELKKRGISKTEASLRLMRSRSFFNNVLYQNGVTQITMERIESILGIPPEAYLLQQEPEAVAELAAPKEGCISPSASGLEDKLERIAAALEALASVPSVQIFRVERCVLLLKQMMCYGMCQYKDFRDKAEQYGFSEDEIKQAIYQSGASQELKGGKDIWLRSARTS